MVTTAQVKKGIADYAFAHLLPQFEPGKQFIAGTAIGALGSKAEGIIQGLSKNPGVIATGIIAENGMIDLDSIYKGALEQMQRQGSLPVNIPLIGKIVFNVDDVTALYQAISKS